MTGEPTDRRPLTSRNSAIAQRAASWLGSTSVTPNQLSIGSILAGVLALVSCATTLAFDDALRPWAFIVAALACQLRLLCNLLDGMVAIEAGKQTRDGAFWNEMPDRIADISILLGVGIAAQWPSLGWAAATLAVFVAYLRELGKGIDGVVDFQGPMAKQHRMALVTIALLLAAGANMLLAERVLEQQILRAALWVCITGCLITLFRRSRSMLGRLQ